MHSEFGCGTHRLLYEIENLLFTNLATRATYYKVLSKHKTFVEHFSLFSGTPVCRGTQLGSRQIR